MVASNHAMSTNSLRPTRRALILGTFGLSSLALLSACGASGTASATSAATSTATTATVAAPTAATATTSSPTTTAPAATSSAAAKPVASSASAAKGAGVPLTFWGLGGQLLTPDRQKVAYNTPLGVQALQVMVDQTKVVGGYQATQAFNAANKPPSGLDLFSAGHLGMFSNGVWALKTYDAVSSLSYGVGPLPMPPNGVHTNFSGCPYLCITQASKLHDEAWQLIDYLESPDPLLRFNVADTTLPPRKSVATSAAFMDTKPQMKYFVGELATTHLQLYVPGSEEIFKVQSQMYTDVLSGKVSAADGAANSVSQVQAILDKNAASS